MAAGPGPVQMLAPTPLALVPVLVAFGWLLVVGVALVMIDIRTHRLPDRLVLPGYLVAGVMFALASLLSGDPSGLLRALLAGAALFAFYLLLRVVSRSGMGGGDVKLAGVLGMYLGWVGWDAVLIGVFAAFLLGGVHGVVLLALRRSRGTAVPFGPWMLAGAVIGIVAALALGAARAAG